VAANCSAFFFYKIIIQKLQDMKTAGIIGGMSWESTQMYYALLNKGIKQALGGHSSCPCLINSVNFNPIAEAMHAGMWNKVSTVLVKAAQCLEAGGADFFVMASNTVHKVAEEVKASVSIPFISITEEVSKHLSARGIHKAGLLGTRFALDAKVYDASAHKYAVELIKPGEAEKIEINRIIFEELVHGIIREESVKQIMAITEKLKINGAKAVILGCTELPLLLNTQNSPLPLADSTKIHTDSILREILN
jgi:aspartate racemase